MHYLFRWFHPDPELARQEKRRREIQELYLKDPTAAEELEKRFVDEKEQQKAPNRPVVPPASLVEWRELPSGIGALKTVELIGADLH